MKKILVVDEDKSMRNLCRFLLTRYFRNPAINFSYNGNEALNKNI
ncbi:MAG: hypothetical protein OEV42_07270 [Deltaproteobacteria bacterium]|nr:hypothetical protein [Deltaproteobacteria bacterium]